MSKSLGTVTWDGDAWIISLSNRGGMMNNAAFAIKNPKESLSRPCFYPNYIFFMDYNGDVIICNHDWGKKFIIGNMYKNSFKEFVESLYVNAKYCQTSSSNPILSQPLAVF